VIFAWVAAAVCVTVAGGCKSDEPYKLELTPVQTRVLGMDFSALPDEGLIDQDGDAFSFESLFKSGKKPAVVTEIYTSCPMPDMCPMLMSKVARAQSQLTEQGVALGDYSIIVLSLDPARDTPEAMRKYAEAHGIELANAHLVTGDKATLDRIMKAMEVGIRQLPDGTFMHSMRTYVVGADGKVKNGFRQSGWNPEHLAERLKAQID
jgi:protein SCO1/2